ncbi:MAG: glycoside hydrolase N-terminal domain-containing protein, partial [Bacteroidaceae bacterium]|nr:glycoside hydrolase N-terminal domain-containing protein [Bacteroidaceae bacterium]
MERKNKIAALLYRTAVHRKIALLILFLIPSLLFSQETQQTSSPQTNPILYSGNGELILEITPKAGNNDINVIFGSLLTAFNINIHSNTATLKQTPPTEDLTTGEVRLQWTDTKGSLTSKTFVSRKDKVAMSLITADKGINIPNIKVTSPSGFSALQMRTKITPNKQGFAIRSTFRKAVCEGSRRYEGLEAVVKVVPDNGRISVSGNEIKPKKVRQALMFIAMAPSEQMEINNTDSLEKAIENVMATGYAALSSKDEKNISPAIYAELLKRNISVHLSLYNQMTIELPTHQPTDKAIVDTYNRHIYHKLCYSTIPSTYTAHHPSSAAYPSSVPLHQQAEAASLLYDYYLYTLDSLFLREEALPYMINVAEKLQRTLKTKDPQGNYIINKTSPTQEVTAANFLLRDLISSSTFLKVNQNQILHWQNILAYMPPYKIDRNDQLRDQL